MRANLHPEFVLRQDRALPYGGEYRGGDGFLEFLKKFMAAFDVQSLENTRTFVGENPDAVVLEFSFRGKVKATGKDFATTLLELWEFKDGKIRGVTPHWFEIPPSQA
jgi:ketosteroid isomerase-like protein